MMTTCTITLSHTEPHTITIPPMGFGAMGISEFYGTTDEAAAKDALQAAVAKGIHIDTADNYAYGRNEQFLKEALNLSDPTQREKVILASKCGIVRDEHDATKRGIDISPDYIQQQVNRSLNNLGTDYLDILYIHRIPKEATPEELTAMMEKLKALKATGVIRAIGLSEASADTILFCHNIAPLSVLQTEYSLMRRGPETDGVLQTCCDLGITFVAYSPLWRGGLVPGFNADTLEEKDFRRMLPTHTGDNWVENQKVIEQLQAFADKKGITLPQLALAWLKAQGVMSIPGMRSVERVEANAKCLDITLTPEELSEINSIAPVGITKGLRYPAAAMEVYGFVSDAAAPDVSASHPRPVSPIGTTTTSGGASSSAR